ncbi:diaminopimelate epimerase [Parvularcula sp. LCG005]|uniref:diaminopimelate epimerase n=1 Tax=Parvularcula sp. LCG005 TaxID=3078805 RepID=UPI00294384D2|nr:diaminopimelate epimerase [Parvularcula sp. LCG005]WOI53401.1 diaminopimelate epimerase [Parvularcula sp. LCG005]
MTARNSLQDLDGLPYWLMDGLGNDFVIVDLRHGGRLTSEAAACLGDRSGPFGCDQIITLSDHGGDVQMGIWNADGSEVGACGNATRCVGWLLAREQGTDATTIGSPAGPLHARLVGAQRVSVDMGVPKLRWQQIPLAEQMDDTRFIDIKLGPIDRPVLWGPSAVNMGNPHCVFFVEDAEAQALDRFGPLIENHPLFPERTNVSVAQVLNRTTIRLRTWERGVGMTKACGTAACAGLVSAVRRRLTDRTATVRLDGGDLEIEWREADEHVIMTGDVRLSGQGVFGD